MFGLFCLLEAGSHCAVRADLRLTEISLPPQPKRRDEGAHRHALTCNACSPHVRVGNDVKGLALDFLLGFVFPIAESPNLTSLDKMHAGICIFTHPVIPIRFVAK